MADTARKKATSKVAPRLTHGQRVKVRVQARHKHFVSRFADTAGRAR